MQSRLGRALSRARGALEARGRAVWNRDRAQLRGPAALGTRLLRMAILVGRGIAQHRLGIQSAALTYYTVFSLVPVLVVVLWIVKALDYLPTITLELPPATAHLASGNEILRSGVRKVLENVEHTSKVTSGIVGLTALLYAVVRLFAYMERALDSIAESGRRRPNLTRLLGYLAFLVLPPLVILIAGLLAGASRGLVGSKVTQFLGTFPGLKLAVAGGVGLSTIWLLLAIFYSAAARARIAFSSAAIGGVVSALLLPTVLWLFAEFQIGMSRGSPLQSGAAAGPVFLLWVDTSWFIVLVGAEVAVAHGVERILIHGARSFRLDALGEQQSGVAIMVHAARAARDGGSPPTVDGLARQLRLPPHLVRALCVRLAARGLLRTPRLGVFVLGCDADRIDLAAVADAIARDPALDPARTGDLGSLGGAALAASLESRAVTTPSPTLRELAS